MGTHRKTGLRVAIKMVQRATMKELGLTSRVYREIEYLYRLGNHPHIIFLYEVISTPSDILLMMEYAGRELFSYIVDHNPVSSKTSFLPSSFFFVDSRDDGQALFPANLVRCWLLPSARNVRFRILTE